MVFEASNVRPPEFHTTAREMRKWRRERRKKKKSEILGGPAEGGPAEGMKNKKNKNIKKKKTLCRNPPKKKERGWVWDGSYPPPPPPVGVTILLPATIGVRSL